MPTIDNEPRSASNVAGWNPARRKPSKSSNAATATITVTSTAVPARPLKNAGSATAAGAGPVVKGGGGAAARGGAADEEREDRDGGEDGTGDDARREVVARRRDARRGGDVRRVGLVLDGRELRSRGGCGRGTAAARTRGLRAGTTRRRLATGRDLCRELLVFIDVGDVDERAHSGGLVVDTLVAQREVGVVPVAVAGAVARLVRSCPDLFVTRFVGDHRHLSSGRFGPVRQWHRTEAS